MVVLLGSGALKMLNLLARVLVLSVGLFCLISLMPVSLSKEENDKVENGFVVHPEFYKPVPVNASSRAGKEAVKKYNCTMCHSIEDKGGCLAPPFDGIGAYRNRQFILARITFGSAAEEEFEKLYEEKEQLMPHLRVPSVDAKNIAQYLLTLPSPSGGFYVGAHTHNLNQRQPGIEESRSAAQSNAKRIAAGKQLFYERGCTACHSIGNIGGHFAPALDDISKRRSKDYIQEHISNAQLLPQNSAGEYKARGTIMPPSGLGSDEISKVTAFLMSL